MTITLTKYLDVMRFSFVITSRYLFNVMESIFPCQIVILFQRAKIVRMGNYITSCPFFTQDSLCNGINHSCFAFVFNTSLHYLSWVNNKQLVMQFPMQFLFPLWNSTFKINMFSFHVYKDRRKIYCSNSLDMDGKLFIWKKKHLENVFLVIWDWDLSIQIDRCSRRFLCSKHECGIHRWVRKFVSFYQSLF